MDGVILVLLLCLAAGTVSMVRGEDPYIFFTWNITYGTISPLGVPQQAIMINNQFPGPNINSTSNNNVVVNVFNNLDEPFLLTWTGIQQRKNSWQDGVLGTNCPIAPGTNYTYHFQVKDQIGSYIYYPSVGMHRAIGGFGGLRINSRLLIPVPYPDPEDDYTVIINDWYTKTLKTLTKLLESGKSIGRPEGVLINGQAAKGDGKDKPLFTMKPGKTYKYRICNAGIKTSVNFRIQKHNMKLVEMEGSHVVQNIYESLDVHAGQCYSVLVTADKEPKDYYMVASTRFTKNVLTSKGIMRYEGGKGPASPELPEAPVGWAWSLNQFRTFRWNLTASAARPNPQGSYHYGAINITRTIKLVNTVDRSGGKLRYALNGVSHVDVPTPLKLAEYYGITDKVFKYDSIPDEPPAKIEKVTVQPNVNNVTFRTFVEIIFENHEKSMQSYHLSGYSFFAVAIEPGTWAPEKRKNYNLLDAISRHTIQVFPNSWAAILLTFDNAGMWNLRSEIWERNYLGQQLYISVLSPERSLRDEYNVPDNAILCGLVKDMPKPPPYSI
ncbi:multi-copper oxidase type 1 family protein [Tripterygium wilfordii]|uniref:Multi-copper oxidase type 1 family protein n=1 Tax=Tripterygium wilfordii TaxID=458696 RepID=A0A7J7BUE2_TRIWF|nr:L-ascorbate oxidase homolog [Tripterygium wilfordii]KAF5725542.1 multi-copper oxidase type 1 family protein [Tripterygium wilfordii]